MVRGVGAVLIYGNQIVIARCMSAAEAGAFWLAMPATTLASFALSLGYMMGSIRFVPWYIEQKTPQFARGYLQQGTFFSCLAGAAVVLLAGLAIALGFVPEQSRFLLIAAAILSIPLTINYFVIDFQRGLHRPIQAYVLQSLANPVLISAGVFALFLFDRASAGMLLVIAVAVTVFLTIGQMLLIKRSDGKWLFSQAAAYETRLWLRTGLPMAITALLGNLANWLDLFIVGLMLPIEQAAIYSVVGRILYVLQFFGSAMNSGVAAQYSRLLHGLEHERLYQFVPRITIVIFLANLVAAPVIIAFRYEILGTFGPIFREGASALVIVISAQLVRCLFGPWDTLLYLAGYERLVTVITLVSTTCLGLGCVLLAPSFGIVGAGTASAGVLTLTSVIGWRLTRFYLNLDGSVFVFLQRKK